MSEISKFWKIKNPVIPLCSIFLVFASSLEAAEIKKAVGSESIEQTQFTPLIYDRQDLDLDTWHKKSNKNEQLLTQETTVEQLQDLKPTDWSYAALRDLIDRYGCITGFPNRTFQGNNTVSRAEFVAGLNNCLNKVESLISNPDSIPQEDVDTVLRLMQEFQSDLAILQGKTDGAQARLEDLEATQFSTTSKLKGEAVFGLGSVLTGDAETIFGSRLRLDIATSFKRRDRLLTRFSSNDLTSFSGEISTFQGNLAFVETVQEDFQLEVLQYVFGIGDKIDFILGATGLEANDIADTINILDGDGGSGSISAFGTRNPIYNPSGDSGLGIVHRPIKQLEISAGYLANSASESTPGNGLFDGGYSALGQITIAPIDNISLAATYIHSYDQSDTETGTSRANLQSRSAELLGEEALTISNSYGLELSWAISDRLIIGGWGGLSKVSNLNSVNQQLERGTQDIWNWAATLALPDLGKEGSLAGIVIGSEPQVTRSSINTENFREDEQRSLHLEAFYQYQISDNVAVTPGVIWITEPAKDTATSDDLVVGTIRTTFSF